MEFDIFQSQPLIFRASAAEKHRRHFGVGVQNLIKRVHFYYIKCYKTANQRRNTPLIYKFLLGGHEIKSCEANHIADLNPVDKWVN